MLYQVCWRYKDSPTSLWFAQFYQKREDAEEQRDYKKEMCCEVKILTIGDQDARN